MLQNRKFDNLFVQDREHVHELYIMTTGGDEDVKRALKNNPDVLYPTFRTTIIKN
jgi:hypothetical protein